MTVNTSVSLLVCARLTSTVANNTSTVNVSALIILNMHYIILHCSISPLTAVVLWWICALFSWMAHPACCCCTALPASSCNPHCSCDFCIALRHPQKKSMYVYNIMLLCSYYLPSIICTFSTCLISQQSQFIVYAVTNNILYRWTVDL